MKLGFIGKFWFETHLKYLVTLMLSKLTLKKSKQTEKLKVITFFSVAHFGLLLPKIRLILAPIWPFLKNFWFRFRLLKDNSMMMINSTDFASNLQKNRKMWTISYLLRWINNYRVLLLVYLVCNSFGDIRETFTYTNPPPVRQNCSKYKHQCNACTHWKGSWTTKHSSDF